MDFGYHLSICWNRGKGQKNIQLHGAKPLRCTLICSKHCNLAVSTTTLTRRNSRGIGEKESHGDTEMPDSEDRNSIISAEVPPSRLSNMVGVYPYSI